MPYRRHRRHSLCRRLWLRDRRAPAYEREPAVDLNRLYSDHQIALFEAARAPSEGLRRVHVVAASLLAGHIGRAQRTLGAAAAPAWETLAAPAQSLLASPGRCAPGYAS